MSIPRAYESNMGAAQEGGNVGKAEVSDIPDAFFHDFEIEFHEPSGRHLWHHFPGRFRAARGAPPFKRFRR